jgi:hypothetical protein
MRRWTHENTHFQSRLFHYLLRFVNIVILHYFDLGMKIPNGVGGFR